PSPLAHLDRRQPWLRRPLRQPRRLRALLPPGLPARLRGRFLRPRPLRQLRERRGDHHPGGARGDPRPYEDGFYGRGRYGSYVNGEAIIIQAVLEAILGLQRLG